MPIREIEVSGRRSFIGTSAQVTTAPEELVQVETGDGVIRS